MVNHTGGGGHQNWLTWYMKSLLPPSILAGECVFLIFQSNSHITQNTNEQCRKSSKESVNHYWQGNAYHWKFMIVVCKRLWQSRKRVKDSSAHFSLIYMSISPFQIHKDRLIPFYEDEWKLSSLEHHCMYYYKYLHNTKIKRFINDDTDCDGFFFYS